MQHPPYVGTIILGGVFATLLGLTQNPTFDPMWLVILICAGALSEWFEVGMYGDSTFSVSVTIVFAAIYLTGFIGVVFVSLAVVAAHYLKNRSIELYKPAFNWATHVLAGIVPLYGQSLFNLPFHYRTLLS